MGPFTPPWISARDHGLIFVDERGTTLSNDNRVLETENFLIFSDASSDQAKIRMGEAAEAALNLIVRLFDISAEDVGIRDTGTKLRVYSARRAEKGHPRATSDGFVNWAYDTDSDKDTSLDSEDDTGIYSDSDIFDSEGETPDVDSDTMQQSAELLGLLRDFDDSHPDFESVVETESGIVEKQLGADKKPVYAGGSGTATTHGADAFNQWFRDVEGVNQSREFEIVLTPNDDGLYTYNNPSFFPLDGQLLGNQGRSHNYHFTYELHTVFTYKGGEIFTFTGDDDLFVFINERLAIDLGGVHGPLSKTADLDAMKDELGIEVGKSYPLDFFFAERHTSQSNFRIETTITDLTPVTVL